MAGNREAQNQTQAREDAERPPGVLARLRRGLRASRVALVVILPFAGVLAGFAWYSLEFEQPRAPGSRLGQGSVVTANPLEATSDAYRQALEQGEANRRDQALTEGESYVPAFQSQASRPVPAISTPILPSAVAPSEAIREPEVSPSRVDKPASERDPLVDRDYPEPQPRGTALLRDDVATVGAAPVVAMVDELLAAWNAAPNMTVIRYDVQPRAGAANDEIPTGTETARASNSTSGRALVQSGQILYAATTVGVDSELGLPVLVELLEEPLRGAVLHGAFERVRDRMVVRFARLSDPRRNLESRVDAYAVGLECECGAVEGQVDRHWFARVVMPAAFGFAEEYLRSAGEPDVTIHINGHALTQRSGGDARSRVARGLAGAVSRTGEVVHESLPKHATVRLPRGMELAVVFVEAVRAVEVRE